MAYPPHLLLAWGGRMGDEEIWSNSLRLVSGTTSDLAELQSTAIDQIDEIATEVAAFVNSSAVPYSSACKMDWIKLNAIGPDGKYWSTSSTNAIYYDTPAATGKATAGPYQVALAITLRTFQQRGLAHSGRFYVPMGNTGDVDAATGQIGVSTANYARDATATLLNAINDNPGLDTKQIAVAVVSKVASPGQYQLVTGVQVGRVPDTQRRRRNALPEDYTTVAPVTGQ